MTVSILIALSKWVSFYILHPLVLNLSPLNRLSRGVIRRTKNPSRLLKLMIDPALWISCLFIVDLLNWTAPISQVYIRCLIMLIGYMLILKFMAPLQGAYLAETPTSKTYRETLPPPTSRKCLYPRLVIYYLRWIIPRPSYG